ncbi:MAG: hypothetical protein IKO20_04000 [Bacteroidaceae bacterium]|nr:hypothetical protein [Bacteroidaceae bacterium]
MAKKREIVAVSFYRDWWEFINEPTVTPDEQLAILRAILAYAFDGVKPDATDRTTYFATFGAIKRIERDNEKRSDEVERVLHYKAKHSVTNRNNTEQSVTKRNNTEQPTNNYIINNEIINSKEKENIKEKEKRFKPPTLDEVQAYCEENSIIMDAAAFYDHYTSNGWKVSGRAAMKDWKAAARNWARRENQYKQNNGTNNTDTDAEFYARVASGLATMPD